MSYNFASNKSKDIQKINWDLSVIDEAHRLRNVFRKSSVIAKNIQDCTKNSFKLLLTATLFQNSLLELYGLSTFIDEYTFGNLESFKAQYSFIYDENSDIFNK